MAQIQDPYALNYAASRAKKVCFPGNLQQLDISLAEYTKTQQVRVILSS